jgi:hypothetical protein
VVLEKELDEDEGLSELDRGYVARFERFHCCLYHPPSSILISD